MSSANVRNDVQFVMYPIAYNRHILSDVDFFFTKAIAFGIYELAVRFPFSDELIATQILYMKYHNKIPHLEHLFKQFEYAGNDLDKGGYANDGQFNPLDEEIDEIIEQLNDEEFASQVLQLAKVSSIINLLNLQICPLEVNAEGELLYAQKPDKSVMVPVNVDILLNARDAKQEDLMMYAVYFAFRSILGIAEIKLTNWGMVMARAFGYSSIKHVPKEVLESELFESYMRRPKRLSTLKKLQGFGIQTFSDHIRGFAFGIGDEEIIEKLMMRISNKKLKAAGIEAATKAAKQKLKGMIDSIKSGKAALPKYNGEHLK